ncbi:MAG TPA: ATP-binding protein [Aquabacterium sp.]|uniref:hybrid sensor histidine kinase/response regulator n=1 Tax=Aquabacterium sp. TaxID=1872578 RepID=UPI002E30EE40|nr:ATP-binding protein [Aquabacterium sp.]HEX5355918.1 ATP-binding protein [Aquabacterium sp.]
MGRNLDLLAASGLRRLLTWLIGFSLWLAGSAWAEPTFIMDQATLSPGTCAEQQEGRTVRLPDDWRSLNIKPPAVGCYRARLYMPRSPVVPWALRIDRLPGNHRVTVNGIQLSTRHMEGHAITSMATLPYLVELPVNVLLAGDNDIEIDVRMNPFRKPGIAPMQAGPLSDMRDDFDRWVGLTVDLPQTLNMSVAGMALFLLLAWRARPRDVIFGYFGCLMLVMCGRNALYFVETISWPAPVVDWFFFAAQAVSTYYVALFGLSYANISLKKLLWPLRFMGFGFPVIGLLAMGTPYLDTLRLVAYPILMVCGILVVVRVVLTAWTRHWLEAIAMTLGPVGTFISVAHDYLFLTPYLDVTALYWTPYCVPIIFLGFALTLMSKFIEAMNLAERMNITLEERVAERTRALEAANQSKTRFLAAASHDLRQPTAAIGLLVSLLRQQAKEPEVKDLTNMLDEAVASMESLLVGLLDISKLDAGAVKPEFQSVGLHDVFQAVRVHEKSAADSKGLRLRFRLPRGPHGSQLMVLTDPMLLHSVLRNLVANAIRYTHSGGVLVAARRRGKHRLRIEVWDTGIGIAPDQLDRIFEEFYQVGNSARDRNRGIGLGLAIVRRTASILGEQVSVKSRVGRGSCFAIELPLNLVAHKRAEVVEAPSQPLTGRVIWLVEDDMLLRRAIGEMLHSWGARTRSWPDGESLLDELPTIMENSEDEDLPDTLITDYRLPGINGLHLVQTLGVHMRAHGKNLQTLIISGDTDPAEIARLSASGLEVLSKPFRSERLLERLNARRTTAAMA